MKLSVLSLLALILSSCATKYEIRNFNIHMFSDDMAFIQQNLNCGGVYRTDKFDKVSNEVFRCSNELGSVFIELETTGPQSEELKQTTFVWKQWNNDLEPKATQTDVRQFAAVFSKMYLLDKEIEFIDSFFNDIPAKFENIVYNVEVKAEDKEFYTVRAATVTFNN